MTELGDTKMKSAMIRVLETSELLQEIVINLPPKRIFLVQAVCKTWQAIVQSKRAQMILYKEPDGAALFPVDRHADGDHTIVRYERELDFNRIPPPSYIWPQSDDTIHHHVSMNAARAQPPGTWEIDASRPLNKKKQLEMFITQPPCTTAEVAVLLPDNEVVYCTLHVSEGITLLHTFEIAKRCCALLQRRGGRSQNQGDAFHAREQGFTGSMEARYGGDGA